MDTTTMLVLAVMAAALITGTLIHTAGLRSFRRSLTIAAPYPLGRMMAQCGLTPDDAAGREYELTVAAAHCAGCTAAAQCSALLDNGRAGEARAVCPNDAFLGSMQVAKAPRVDCVLRRFA